MYEYRGKDDLILIQSDPIRSNLGIKASFKHWKVAGSWFDLKLALYYSTDYLFKIKD